ncbi:hypothetical protein ACFL2X_00490 [Candidatus Latescibacterota bacterium]
MKKTLLHLLIISIAVFMFACDDNGFTENKDGVVAETLHGKDYGVVVYSDSNPLVLMGHLSFQDIDGDIISGGWYMEAWGEQPHFSTLPVNMGEEFPGNDKLEAFTGQIFGDMIIINLDLPGSEESLGIVLERQDGDELFGSATLLPDKAFDGKFKALIYSEADSEQ